MSPKMEVNAVAAIAAKAPIPLVSPTDTIGEAFADFLQTTTATSDAAPDYADPQNAASTPSAPRPIAENRKSTTAAPQALPSQPPPQNTSLNASAKATAPAGNRAQQPSTSSNHQSADQQPPATADSKPPVTTAAGAKTATSGDQLAATDKVASGDPVSQNSAVALLTLLAATTGQSPVAAPVPVANGGITDQLVQSASIVGQAGTTGTVTTEGTAATSSAAQTNGASGLAANSLASALLGQASAAATSGKQAPSAVLLPGFKEALAQPASASLPGGGVSGPLTDLLAGHGNGSNGQISVVASASGSFPQPLLTGAVLAATGALSDPTTQNAATAVPQLQSTNVEQDPFANLPVLPTTGVPAQTSEFSGQAQPQQSEVSGTPFAAIPGIANTNAPSAPTISATAQPTLLHTPAEQIAVRIAKAVDDGIDRIRIQLDPADLGRVEVKMEVGHDGRVLAAIAAERPQTLDMLQRDAAGLQRALQDAGLNADGQSLSFSLRSNDGQAQRGGGQNSNNSGHAATNDSPVQIASRPLGTNADVSGLDIRV